jgi:hypothetical protein
LCEVGWAFIPIRPPFSGSGSSAEVDRSLHQQRAVRRARSRLRQLVLSANADHLLTLTYRENVTDVNGVGFPYRFGGGELGAR